MGVPLPITVVTETFRFYETAPAALNKAAVEELGEQILTEQLEAMVAPYGTVTSSWQRIGEDKILMFVNLPEGAHGELIAPRGWRCSDCALSGGKKIILTRE